MERILKLGLKNDTTKISEHLKVLQVKDPSCNLVLFGIQELENTEEELISSVVKVTAEQLKVMIPTTINTSRIGISKPLPTNRPRPVRVYSQNSTVCISGGLPFSSKDHFLQSMRIYLDPCITNWVRG